MQVGPNYHPIMKAITNVPLENKKSNQHVEMPGNAKDHEYVRGAKNKKEKKEEKRKKKKKDRNTFDHRAKHVSSTDPPLY